jgi:hypothetical protein
VRVLCEEVAEVLAKSGSRTILIRLAEPQIPADVVVHWTPGQAGAGGAVRPNARGFDELVVHSGSDIRFLFNNPEGLRFTFCQDLAIYQMVVVELADVLCSNALAINAASVATACDATYLVCRTGFATKAAVREAARALANCGVRLAGTILNDDCAPTPARDLAKWPRRLQNLAPGWSSRLARIISTSNVLN